MISMDTSWRLDLANNTLSKGEIKFEFAPYRRADGLPAWWRKVGGQSAQTIDDLGLLKELEAGFLQAAEELKRIG